MTGLVLANAACGGGESKDTPADPADFIIHINSGNPAIWFSGTAYFNLRVLDGSTVVDCSSTLVPASGATSDFAVTLPAILEDDITYDYEAFINTDGNATYQTTDYASTFPTSASSNEYTLIYVDGITPPTLTWDIGTSCPGG